MAYKASELRRKCRYCNYTTPDHYYTRAGKVVNTAWADRLVAHIEMEHRTEYQKLESAQPDFGVYDFETSEYLPSWSDVEREEKRQGKSHDPLQFENPTEFE